MKTRNKTKKLLLSFVVIILLLTLSFIILAIKYTNLKNSKSMYKVEIIKVDKLNPIKAGTNNPTSNANIINSGETLSLSFDLYTPNDEITYVATVKNIGDIKAKIIDVIVLPDYIKDDNSKKLIYPAELSINSIKGKILNPGDQTTLKITVTYKNIQSENNLLINIPCQISILTESV